MAELAPWLRKPNVPPAAPAAAAPPAETAPPAGGVRAPWLPPEPPGVLEDVARSVGSGFRTGLESIPGTPQDLIGLGARGVNKLFGTEYTGDVPYLPSSEDIHQATTPVFGESYQPQTTAGKYARTATEFGAGSLGPGGLLRNAAIGVGSGLASEAAGQLTEGTALEPWARVGAGLASGAGADSAMKTGQAVRQAPFRQAEQAVEDAAEVHGVRPTKGQRSGDVTQQQREEQMLHGSKGSWAQRLMEGRKRENLEAIKDSSAKIQDRTAPTRGSTPVDSGGNLNWSARRRAEAAKAKGGADIDAALKSGVMIDADALRGLPAELQTKLAGPHPFVPEVILDSTTPIASQAMERVEKFVKQAEDPAVKEVSLAGAEQLRRNLGALSASTPTDARALSKIKQHFDDWYDDTIAKHANRGGPANALPGPSVKSADDVFRDLQAGRATYREGARVTDPRGAEKKQPGAGTVAKIATEGQHAEDTARLFKPNDRGDLSPQAIDALDRLTSTGATGGELDQVRGIVLDQLMTGDPGKVATRITNFTRGNPTAAEKLFTRDELASIKAWGDTNKTLVPNPLATNPSKSSYGVINEMGRLASRQASSSGGVLGALLGGPVGAVLGAGAGVVGEGIRQGKGFLDARKALAPANRDTLAEVAVKGAGSGARKVAPGATQAAQTFTINDPDDPDDGQQVKVISEGKSGYKVRLRNGQEKLIGKSMVR